MSLLVDAKKADDIALQAVFSLKAKRNANKPLAYSGDPVGFITQRLDEHLWSKQEEICRSVATNRRTAVMSCHAAGKALALDTPLPTPTGWTTMGEVQPGDELLDEQGTACTVTAVTPIETLPAYRVTFSDRSSIVASSNHLWRALDLGIRSRKARDWRDEWDAANTVSTEQMASNQTYGAVKQRRWRIPTTRALQTDQPWTLPWSPYTLGAWLGDGTFVRAQITAHQDDADHMATMTGGTVVAGRKPTTRLVILPGRSYVDSPGRTLKFKHIPQSALRASQSDRLELLRGLMDTDGTVARGGGVEFMVCDERLADSMAELVMSLGWIAWRRTKIAKLYGRAVGTAYRIAFRPDVCPFHLERKRKLWQAASDATEGRQSNRQTQRTIVSIEPIEAQPVKCVEVDSPRRLYLAGKAMIPTHNSFLSARIVAYWLETHKPGEAFVVTTAPSAPQVKAILWREINRAHAKGRLIGRTNQTEWHLMVNGSEELVAFGRKPSDYDPTSFQGIHARYVLVIADEACGIPENIYNAAASLTANEGSRILAIGNPDDPTSHFAKICGPGSGWNVINIDGYDSPNFTDEWVPDELRELLISHTYVNELIQDVGEDSPVFISKVRGRFPEIAEDVVIQLSYIRACQKDRELAPNMLLPVELGVDVGGGGDKTTARERRGLSIGRRYSWSTPDPKEAAGHIVQAIRETGATRVKIDSIGIGWAMAGWLQAMKQQGVHNADVLAVNVATVSTNPQRYPKLRDQLWWEIGHDAMQRGILDLRGLDDTTIAQLIAPKWSPDSMGRIKIEPKDETKKRIKRSPDDADAVLMAYFSPPQVAGPAAVAGERPETRYVPR